MLVLTLTDSESVCIGENAEIRVTVVRIDRHKVRLGFVAPDNVPVLRERLAEEQLAYYGRLLVPASAAEILRQRGRTDG